MTQPLLNKYFDKIIDDFRINTNVKKINLSIKGLRAFEFLGKPYKAFILDSEEIMKVACYPSIVGEELDKLNSKIAEDTFRFLKSMSLLNNKILVEHVLRASLGYKVHTFLKENLDVSELWIRTRYVLPSYRDHDDEEKALEIAFEDFKALKDFSGKKVDLFIQDTVASGRTAEVALSRLFELAEKHNVRVKKLLFYGFLSEQGLDILWDKILKKRNLEFVAIALGNITPLSENGYDMPVYGPDEYYYSKTGNLRNIGAVISEETLKDWLPHFIPGADQPGDWSARQSKLFNGYNFEQGDIKKHLINSEKLITSLKGILEVNFPWLFNILKHRINEELNNLSVKKFKY